MSTLPPFPMLCAQRCASLRRYTKRFQLRFEIRLEQSTDPIPILHVLTASNLRSYDAFTAECRRLGTGSSVGGRRTFEGSSEAHLVVQRQVYPRKEGAIASPFGFSLAHRMSSHPSLSLFAGDGSVLAMTTAIGHHAACSRRPRPVPCRALSHDNSIPTDLLQQVSRRLRSP